jgi:hypothetical protein
MSHLDVWPGLLITTRHNAGTVTGTLLSSGNTASDESDALSCKVFGAAVCVGVVRVTAVDDDITFLDATLSQEELNEVVDRLASHDEHHHAAGLLELRHEILDGVGADNRLALSLCFMLTQFVFSKLSANLTIVQESVDLSNAARLLVCAYCSRLSQALTFC